MRNKLNLAALLLASTVVLSSCDRVRQVLERKSETVVKEAAYPERVYWGDLHLHTANSVDAFGFGNRLGPEDALRFAKGEQVTSTTGIKAQLARPLDFLVITDHAEGMGSTMALYNAPRFMIRDPQMLRWYDMMHKGPKESVQAMAEVLHARATGTLPAAFRDQNAAAKRTHGVWQSQLSIVERYNDPGKFTAMFGFEYTLMQGGNNLHRNVIFRDGKDKVAQIDPLDPSNELTPDKLWDYMDAYQARTGGKVLAIPHNSNVSNGLMFMMTDSTGAPMSAAYARRRAAHEPVVEITQIKGDSEAHPFLSPNDEFAGFGTAGWDIGNLMLTEPKSPNMYAAEYVREALKRGLLLEQKTGTNPYKFGLIGSTDSHTSLSTGDENNFFGKHSGVEPGPDRAMATQNLGKGPGRFGWQYLAGGYAGVWAKANTRSAIWDALERREVYATTGPRMVVRLFAGWDFKGSDLKGDWVKAGYARGVPMGGSLTARSGGRPSMIVSALKDPAGANLDRVQVVKGWVDRAGALHEKIFDVVWSDMDKRKVAGGKVPAVGDTVDIATASYKNSIGAPVLATVWSDPEFDANVRSFYYLRVLEIPTPRWPVFDALRYHIKLGPDVQLKAQERAYSSPVWYTPKA